MALINRISRLFKADFHAVLDQIEEPEALLKQAIRDMEDDLANTEQRSALCAHDQEALSVRKGELEGAIAEIGVQLDLCFESGKDDLAKTQIKKKLEAERLLKRLTAKHAANEKYLDEQRTMLDENQATLESLRQKAELFAQRTPAYTGGESEFDDIAWMTREMTVGDDEVEIAYLREKSIRSSS
ncbi:MAG: PspA/IM30 family protein [Gammaproteobacteria bacterium]|jgi:phage shock protein A|nr:PspA/IM30 family protein [Gammaproteobacteria bacterium]MDH3751987.1 PspA/IM30 family protein [Gammaproteobacteria bacterium]